VRICAPEAYWPDSAVVAAAAEIAERTGGSVSVAADPQDACKGADVLATDVWTSMGQEGQENARTGAMIAYRLDAAKLGFASPACKVLHCLPAHRGEEITAEVIDGPASLVFEQAENRLHAQKALLCFLLDPASAAGRDEH
jgi:ornithine carbamoyltransferase